nr:hypothetical protein [Tanacetum cinerariifolium]
NEVVERKNKTIIDAARTMLADSLLPIPFWVEAVNTACYVQNKVLVNKPHNKTPYELLLGRSPSIGFMRPFGCPVTILNTLDPLGKFNGKADEEFLVGYSVNSKAFRVFNSRNRIVQETLHINFLENQPNVTRSGPKWLFDIDTLTQSMNYQPVVAENQPNHHACIKEILINIAADASFDVKKNENAVHVSPSSSDKPKKHDEKAKRKAKGKNPSQYPDDSNMSALEDIIYSDDEEDVGVEADFSNLETNISVGPIPTTRVYKDHHVTQIIGELTSAPQTRSMARMVKEQGGLTQINDKDFHTCMFACFLSQEEPKKVHQALKDPSWIKAINKKDERGIVIRNKARLVVQEHTQDEVINYDEVFAPVARIEAIRLFLAYASFMGFMVYQTDVKSAFLYGTIEEEVYVCQPPGFEDPDYPDKVYKVVKALYELHQASRAWYETLANYLLENGFQRGKIDQTLFIKKQKYVKSTSTPIETEKPLLKDPNGENVDVHIYRHFITAVSYKLMLFGLTKDVAVKLMLLGHKKKAIVTEDVIRQDLRLDDADGVECLPIEEIFAELARMGYEKPPPKLTMVRNADSPSKFLMRIGKGFSRVKTPLFTTMIVPVQAQSVTPPPSPPQAQPAPPSTSLQEQPTTTSKSSMTLLNTLMKKVKKLERKRRSKSFGLKRLRKVGGKIAKIDADEDITLVDAKTQVDLGAEHQGRKDDDNAATKEVSAAEPTVFEDEEVTMTMAQTLIKIKAKKARILDEQMAKRLHVEEVEQAAAREKQEKDDLEKAEVLQHKYDDKQENIEWNLKPGKNMIIYLKNMDGYKIEHFRGCRRTFKKRVAEETLLQESFKKLKAVEVSGSESTQETPTNDPKEMSEEDVKNMLEIVPVSEFKVEALQVNVTTAGSRLMLLGKDDTAAEEFKKLL